ncbi:glycosyltransferase [Lancefieldella rimae]|uniref:glycosyltransferase n=1 Tax=Lancefieldella rimae TaxID=1383 RepID=UPI002889415E|nr:glycosyltransferase [Lancefieldella rimae]
MYTPADHTFAICAYGESPYLEELICSLTKQTLPTTLLLATSTPNDLICNLCEKYNIKMYINEGPGGIAGDWNFAVSCCTTPLVTIAHQDDIYKPTYAEEMLARINASSLPLIYFTNYGELRDGREIDDNKLLNIKRRLLYSLGKPENAGKQWAKRRALKLGCAICCPSVTLCLPNLELPVFEAGFGSNLDWQAWEKISRREGDFLYNTNILMLHRIHEDSETSHLIHDNRREAEDLAMLEKFWPTPMAKLINLAYKKGQKSNG